MWAGRRIPFAWCLAAPLLLCGCFGRNHVDPDYRFRDGHLAELREQPRTHPDDQRVRTLLLGRQLLIGEMLLGEILADALQPLDEARRLRGADLAMHEHQQLAVAVEAAAVVVGGDMLAKVRHHRPVRPPAKALRDLEPIAVERAQLDDAEPVEAHQIGDAFGIGEAIGADHLLEGPLAQAADREQQQAPIGDDRLLLLERQLAAQRLRVGDLARELGKVHLQHAQHVVDSRQRHVGLGEHALDARLRHPELRRQIGIGDVDGLQLGLECADEVLSGAHRGAKSIMTSYRRANGQAPIVRRLESDGSGRDDGVLLILSPLP